MDPNPQREDINRQTDGGAAVHAARPPMQQRVEMHEATPVKTTLPEESEPTREEEAARQMQEEAAIRQQWQGTTGTEGYQTRHLQRHPARYVETEATVTRTENEQRGPQPQSPHIDETPVGTTAVTPEPSRDGRVRETTMETTHPPSWEQAHHHQEATTGPEWPPSGQPENEPDSELRSPGHSMTQESDEDEYDTPRDQPPQGNYQGDVDSQTQPQMSQDFLQPLPQDEPEMEKENGGSGTNPRAPQPKWQKVTTKAQDPRGAWTNMAAQPQQHHYTTRRATRQTSSPETD